MKNSKVKMVVRDTAAQTAELHSDDKPNVAALMERSIRKVQRFSKIADEVACSDHWVRNEPIPHGLDLFPQEWFMRYSDLFYPVAKGGGIWIDTPSNGIDQDRAERKLQAYRKMGVRYTYIAANEGATEVLMRLDPVLPKGNEENEL